MTHCTSDCERINILKNKRLLLNLLMLKKSDYRKDLSTATKYNVAEDSKKNYMLVKGSE